MWVIVLCKKIIICLFVFCYLSSVTVYAQSESVSANYAVSIDMATKNILYDKCCNEKASMASTTKIMTCIIACKQGDFDQTVVVTDEMLNGTEGSLIYLKQGDSITLYDLVVGAMLASGNDAANVIAFVISGSIEEFCNLMNEYAKNIGMKNTNFETPSGLDSKNHYSTAYDMALLGAYALNDETFSSICKMQSAEIKINGEAQTVYNHNKLLSIDEDCVGIKTGYTDNSGRCLVSAYKYKSSTIIIVTLCASDDWNDHKKILDFSKKKYRLTSQTEYFELDIVGAQNDKIVCEASFDVSYISSFDKKAYFYPIVYAPILKSSKVGVLELYSDEVYIGSVDIIVPESVKAWQTTK